jgi:L-rhamnonate dehydratase
MKIKSIETFRLDLPDKKPAKELSRRPNYNSRVKRATPINRYPEFPRTQGRIPGQSATELWVKVTAEDGTFGLGSTRGWGETIDPIIKKHFTPLLIGRDCFAIEFLNDLMWRMSHRAGPGGIATLARSAVDLALWDLKGKLLEVPVYSLLGGPARDAVTYYCTGDDLDWAMELGFSAFKLSNGVFHEEGTEGLNILEEKVAKAREEVGANADLMINPTGSYNVEFAARLMERLKPYNLRWLEEPLMNFDIRGLQELKRAVPTVPIATGEGHFGRHVFLEMVERRCVDILQPDIKVCGGLSEAMKIYAIGEAAGLQTIVHTGYAAPGQHFSFAVPDCPMAEFWLATDPGVPLEYGVKVPGTPVPVNGKLVPSSAPGFGQEIREQDLIPWDR